MASLYGVLNSGVAKHAKKKHDKLTSKKMSFFIDFQGVLISTHLSSEKVNASITQRIYAPVAWRSNLGVLNSTVTIVTLLQHRAHSCGLEEQSRCTQSNRYHSNACKNGPETNFRVRITTHLSTGEVNTTQGTLL